MKNFKKALGIIFVSAIIMCVITSCPHPDPEPLPDDYDIYQPTYPDNPDNPNNPTGGSNGGNSGSNTMTWTAVENSTFGTSDIMAIAFGGNKFVAGGVYGKMAYSTDGVTWTAIPPGTGIGTSRFGTDDAIRTVAYGNGKFVVGSYGGKMAYSTDGVTWTAVPNSTFGTNAIYAITFGNSKFIACGHDAGIAKYIAYSEDGVTWTAASDINNNTIEALAFGSGKFVGVPVSSNYIVYSEDGLTWTDADNVSYLFGTAYGSSIKAIAYGNGMFIAGGISIINDKRNGKMVYSTNGETWLAVADSTFGTDTIIAIAIGNSKFVAVYGSSKIAISTNGTTWTAVANNTFGTSNIIAIANGYNRFVAVGRDGKMAYSNN
jgi:hypothetical protein